MSDPAASPKSDDPLLQVLDNTHLFAALHKVNKVQRVGQVSEAFGTLIRATGLQASLGEL